MISGSQRAEIRLRAVEGNGSATGDDCDDAAGAIDERRALVLGVHRKIGLEQRDAVVAGETLEGATRGSVNPRQPREGFSASDVSRR